MNERYGWHAKVKKGFEDEYQRRHDNIWPEMKKLLKEAGICNYSIFRDGDDLFGYYECSKGAAFAQDVQNKSPIVKKWDAYMKDILIWEADKDQPRMKEVFRLD